jgi:ribosome modulation factor
LTSDNSPALEVSRVAGTLTAQAGAQAAQLGQSEDSCPYPADGDTAARWHRYFWLLGWRSGGANQ